MLVRQTAIVRRHWRPPALVLLLFSSALSTEANVYATDIKLNGSTNNAAILPASPVQISYLLNEPATAGLCLQIYSGASVVWTNALAAGDAGTAAGSNCRDLGRHQPGGPKRPGGSLPDQHRRRRHGLYGLDQHHR